MITKIERIRIASDLTADISLQDYDLIEGEMIRIGQPTHTSITPSDDLSTLPDDIYPMFAALYTPEVIAEYEQIETPTVEQAKAAKVAQIATERYLHEVSGILYEQDEIDYVIRSDRDSVSRLKETVDEIIAGTVASINWKCMDNRWLTINAANVGAIKLATLSHVMGCFDKEKVAQESIALLETVEAVNAYTVDW